MIIDFLNTKLPKDELAVALKVLREFKGNESQEEWMWIPFQAWAKFEQLQEYLEYLVEGKPLADDTVRHLAERIGMNLEFRLWCWKYVLDNCWKHGFWNWRLYRHHFWDTVLGEVAAEKQSRR